MYLEVYLEMYLEYTWKHLESLPVSIESSRVGM